MMGQRSEGSGVRRGRAMTQLRAGLERSLSAYAAAASAAGVSLLALSPSAEAKVVYTPAHTSIPFKGAPVPLDLNHDGVVDFSFRNYSVSAGGGNGAFILNGSNKGSNAMWGRGADFSYGVFASALRAGFVVGPNKSYFQKANRGLMCESGWDGFSQATATYGQWLYAERRYLGLKFTIGSEFHYGWARFNVAPSQGGLQATLTGHAYETVPNKPIVTGKTKGPDVVIFEPASLGRLAQGASGIAAWRTNQQPAGRR